MRDIGPTFVLGADGELGAVDWVFNGWGGQDWARWDRDAKIGAAVAGWAGVPVISSALVNEGGGIQVDGQGTVLVTETGVEVLTMSAGSPPPPAFITQASAATV